MDINDIVGQIDTEQQDNMQNGFNNIPPSDKGRDGKDKKSKKDKGNKGNSKNFLEMSKNMKIMGGICGFIIFIIAVIFSLKYFGSKNTPPAFLQNIAGGKLLIHNSNTPFRVSNILKAPLKKKSITPQVFKSNKVQTISKPAAINKVMPANNKSNNNVSVSKKIASAKSSNNLNDLFSIKYQKHSPAKHIIIPQGMPNQHQIPSINGPMPNFNMQSIKNKLKNFKITGSSNNFTVSGYSGGFVMVNCNNKNEYMKVGGISCGYTLLRADSSSAVFTKHGKAKNFTY